jgi:ATP-dependent RNA helicase SUPV3L1/SUV3
VAEAEMEVFYTFTRAPRQRPRQGGQPQRAAEPRVEGEERGGFRGRRGREAKAGRASAGQAARQAGGRQGQAAGQACGGARPPRPEKPIDPDNPFAALLALKQRS